MTLTEEIATARRQVVSDGYDMSIGEIMSLYRENELVINPVYQRLFRWTPSQKTKFIESLLLGIPIPPIFVFQRKSGVWELIDGLQRLSTILEFTGLLRGENGEPVAASDLSGTNLLPSLAGMRWEQPENGEGGGFEVNQQLQVKRARMRVEILKQESDEEAKFELFQRLNTGGSALSPQEVRNCVLVMIDPNFYEWLRTLAQSPAFTATVVLTEAANNEQRPMELALRFVAYRRDPYRSGLDVNEYLDDAARRLASLDKNTLEAERIVFESTFGLLNAALGSNTFKRWDGVRHAGQFLISGFDAIAHGVAVNLSAIEDIPAETRETWLVERIHGLWAEQVFRFNSGMGVRGSTRLTNLLPFGERWFRP